MSSRKTCCCSWEHCNSIATQLHNLGLKKTCMRICKIKKLVLDDTVIEHSDRYYTQRGVNAIDSDKCTDLSISNTTNDLCIQAFHYKAEDRCTLYRAPKFHHLEPGGLKMVYPIHKPDDALKELEFIKHLYDNNREMFNKVEKEIIGLAPPTAYLDLLNQYNNPTSPQRKKANHNKTPQSTPIRTTSLSEAPTKDLSAIKLSSTEQPTSVPSTTVQPISTAWKTDNYKTITEQTNKKLCEIDEEAVNKDKEKKDILRDTHPMQYNAATLDALRGRGTLEVPTNKIKPLEEHLIMADTTTNNDKVEIATCELRQREFSKRKAVKKTNVKVSGKIDKVKSAANKIKQDNKRVSISMEVNVNHIYNTLFPINDLASKDKSKMVENLKKAGYTLMRTESKFSTIVYCDGVAVGGGRRKPIEGLWTVKDTKNGDRIAYVDTKGNLPLAEKFTWNQGGEGVIYVLVGNVISVQSIQQAITTLSKYNIDHLPLAILYLIREVQQNQYALDERTKRDNKMEQVYNHQDYDLHLERLITFLIVLREVYTCYIHLMTITMLIRRAWIAWNFMRCEWDWMFAQNEIVIREDSRRGNNNVANDTVLNDGVIISCSNQGADKTVWRWYNTTSKGLATSNEFMKLTVGRTPIELLDLITSVFDMGIDGTRAEAHTQMMFLSAIQYDGGLPHGELMEGLCQFSHKKRYLVMQEKGIFEAVAMDRHIKKVFGFFAPEDLTTTEKWNWALTHCHQVGELYGADANNMIGQLSQWLNSAREEYKQREVAITILNQLAQVRPDFRPEVNFISCISSSSVTVMICSIFLFMTGRCALSRFRMTKER